MHRPRRVRLAICWFTLAALCGCSTATTSTPPSTSPAAPAVPAASTGYASTPGSAALAGLVADADSLAAAKAAAVAGMTAFAQPDLDFELWWAGLEPLLSGSAIQAYRTVDPAQIPATEVVGEASLPGWDTPRIARVGVPTDAGVYLVIVSRNEADPVWRVERITPPEAR